MEVETMEEPSTAEVMPKLEMEASTKEDPTTEEEALQEIKNASADEIALNIKSEAEGENAVIDSNHLQPEVPSLPLNSECLDNSDFAVICSFFEKFGQFLQVGEIAYDDLQTMLENTNEVPEPLMKLHVVLLRRVYKSVPVDKWEKFMIRFGHAVCSQDGWELERFGYKKSKLQTKLRLLKNLLEAQFDYNVKFKSEVNKLTASDLRLSPLGRDCEGQLYWYQVDNDANLRVYREDVDDESWEIVATTREGLVELISKLEKGDVKRPELAAVLDEDSNEKEIETKEILRDTGKVEEDEESTESDESESEESEDDEDEVPETKDKVPPFKINNGTVKQSVIVDPVEKMDVDEIDDSLSNKLNDIVKEKMEVEDQSLEQVNNIPEKQDDVVMKDERDKDNITNISETYQTKNKDTEDMVSEIEDGNKDKKEILEISEHKKDLELQVKKDVDIEVKSGDKHVQDIKMKSDITPTTPATWSNQKEIINTPLVEAVVAVSSNLSSSEETLVKTEIVIQAAVTVDVEPPPDSSTIPATTKETEEGKINVPVEEPCTTTKAWICGENDNTLPQKEKSQTDADKITEDLKSSEDKLAQEADPESVEPKSNEGGSGSLITGKDDNVTPISSIKSMQVKEELSTAAVVAEEKVQEDKPSEEITTTSNELTSIGPAKEEMPSSSSITATPVSEGNAIVPELPTSEAIPPISKSSSQTQPLSKPNATSSVPNFNPVAVESKVHETISSSTADEVPNLPTPTNSNQMEIAATSLPPPEENIPQNPENSSNLSNSNGTTDSVVPEVELPSKEKENPTPPKGAKEKPNPLGLSGLVSYGSSSEDDHEETSEQKPIESNNAATNEISDLGKRKALSEEAVDGAPSKMPKMDDKNKNDPITIESSPFNPIVGETIEECVIKITGEGSGAACEGGNNPVEIEDNNQKENLDVHEEAASTEESQEEAAAPAPKKRGRKPGSGKKKPGPKPISTPRNSEGGGAPRGRKRKEETSSPLDTLEVNGSGGGGGGDNDRPVRASRRIAQIRQKEEEERRQIEEERLAQLKAAQLRKQQKRAEMSSDGDGGGSSSKKGRGRPKTKKDGVSSTGGDYLPSPADSSEESGDGDEDEFAISNKKEKKKRKRRKNGSKPKIPGQPWATSSDEDSEAVEEEEEEYHYEEEEHLHFNESDHEFSPESDLEGDADAKPMRHARTAKRGEVEEEETGCKKCGKGDHPEWILLCDKCDHGWHASCLQPQLWVIPEGEWFCPPCQHIMLISKLNENLIEYDKLLKKRENEILRKKRLSFVAISLENVLPDKEKDAKSSIQKEESERSLRKEEKKRRNDQRASRRRRRILSDEDDLSGLSDNFIDDKNSSEESKSRRSSEDSDSDGPIYKLRARRAAKSFDYKAYDEMINSACRASDDEEQEELEVQPEVYDDEEEEVEENGEEEENGEDPEDHKPSGKNEAYEKHLKELEDQEKEKSEGKKEKGEGKKEKVEVVEGEETDEELLDEKEKNRRRELKKASGNKRKKRSFRDLEDFSDEDSDEDFKGSEVDDDEEVDEDAAEEEESDWSGDKDDSDDSIAVDSRAKKGKLGRRDKYVEVGSVRRSTRRRKSRISYDESDEEEEAEEGEDKWQSNESEEDEETPSESDDETYGKRKKKKPAPKSTSASKFFLGATITNKSRKGGGSGSSKKRKKKVDEDDVDRAWSSSQGSKAKKSIAEQKVERRTRGRKINFKDILESGESDDDGNILPKRRRISSGEEDLEDEDEAETSRRLAEQIREQNQREEAMYAMQQKAQQQSAGGGGLVTARKSVPTDELGLEAPLSIDKDLISKPLEQIGGGKPSSMELQLALAKPVPAPPVPPSLAKGSGRSKKSKSPKKDSSVTSAFGIPLGGSGNPSVSTPPHGAPSDSSPLVGMQSSSDAIITSASSPSKKSKSSSSALNLNPISHSGPMMMTPGMQQAGIPMDISRVPNPSLFQGNPAMRPFHPMWVRNPGPPPYGSSSPPTSIGKPPPLNSSAFMPQHGNLGSRPGYPSPPPLRIPGNPPGSPLQAFQHFGPRAPDPGMYRMPPRPPGPGLPGILAAGLHQGSPERFFGVGGPSPYPYGLMPPHTQSQPPPGSMFGAPPPFDFRHGESFKDESRGAVHTGPPQQGPGISGAKDEGHPPPAAPPESEFGGLVSYFSSQRSEEDMES